MRRITHLLSVLHGQMIQKDVEEAGNLAGTLMISPSLTTKHPSVILTFSQTSKIFRWLCHQFTVGLMMKKIINLQLHTKQSCNMWSQRSKDSLFLSDFWFIFTEIFTSHSTAATDTLKTTLAEIREAICFQSKIITAQMSSMLCGIT